jgi:hypothetical protein
MVPARGTGVGVHTFDSSRPARARRSSGIDPHRLSPTSSARATGRSEATETSQRETLWPIRWQPSKGGRRRRRSGTRRPRTSVRAERSGASSRERREYAMNGRRGAGRSDVGRLPTRRKPSKGGAHRVIPRAVRGGRSIARSAEHQRTPRDQPGEPQIWCQLKTRWRPGTEQTVEVVETTRAERVGRRQPPDRSGATAGDVATRSRNRAERESTFLERPGRGARIRTQSSRRGQTDTGRPVEVDRSGQNAGDEATGEAVNRDRKTPERAQARASTRWPSETTNHEVGQSGRPTTDK